MNDQFVYYEVINNLSNNTPSQIIHTTIGTWEELIKYSSKRYKEYQNNQSVLQIESGGESEYGFEFIGSISDDIVTVSSQIIKPMELSETISK